MYFADTSNYRIRKVTVSTGIITTFAGTGTQSYSGDNGPATSATLNSPFDVALDSSGIDFSNLCVFVDSLLIYFCLHHLGNVYIADSYNHRIRKVTVSTGIITTIAGTGMSSYSGDNGPATSAELYYPLGVKLDTSGKTYFIFSPLHLLVTILIPGNIYIADTYNHRIRKVTVSTGIITTIAGSSTSGSYSGDNGQAASAALNRPYGIALDSAGTRH